MLVIASLLSGLVFGAGLLISGMVKPTKVLAFLDIFGAWDPSLAVVMVAADGRGTRSVSSGFHAREWPLAATACGSKRLADQNPHRPAAYRWGGIIRSRLGPGWFVPGAGPGKPCDAVAGCHRLRCGHGGRHDSSKYLAAIPGDHIARKSARHRRRRMSQTLDSPKPSPHADLARCSAAEVLPGNPARASPP